MFSSLARKDRRAKGGLYRAGVDARRPAQVDAADGGAAGGGSPAVAAVRDQSRRGTWSRCGKTLARRAVELIDPDAWVIDDTGFVKDGAASPCVARQYSGTLGKVGNCQVAVSVHAATDAASAPLDWRLYVPERWDEPVAGDPAAAAAVRRRP